MRIVTSFLALPYGNRLLLLKALIALVFVRLALGIVPAEWLRAWATRLAPNRRLAKRPAERITWAVSACARRLPGCTCLVQAFALQRLLSREGHVSELHIGVARHEAGLAAHAWIVCAGMTLIGESHAGEYAPLVAWRVARPDDA